MENKHSKINLSTIMPSIGIDNKIIVNGFTVKVSSLRLRTMKKSCKCVSCGREGTHFRLQFNGNETPHLGLWSDDNIEMTKDHIIPKSFGGYDCIDNMQTMCRECNNKKQNGFSKEDFSRGVGYLSYEEALFLKEIKLKRDLENKNLPREIIDEKFVKFKDIEEKFYLYRKTKNLEPFFVFQNSTDYNYLMDVVKYYISKTDGVVYKKSFIGLLFPKTIIEEQVNIYIKNKFYSI